MKISQLITIAVSTAILHPAAVHAQAEPTAEPQQFESWEQLSPQVKAAVLYIMAAGMDSMARYYEQGVDSCSTQAHIIFLEEVLKLDVSFLTGDEGRYFTEMLRINKIRLEEIKKLSAEATEDEVIQLRKQHAAELSVLKRQYSFANIDKIILSQLRVMQQKHMQQSQKEAEARGISPLRVFAEKLREESVMQF